MFHARTGSFTRAIIVGGVLSLTAAVADTYAAPPAGLVNPQQSQKPSDDEIAAKIRKAMADDKALAAYAGTVRIIVSEGLVSLKGAVRSEADKKAIGQKADAVAGEANVMNNLFVSAEKAETAAKKPTP
jgi:osmotically-inducible protein OsmY